ncbi:hypothetical protein HIM_08394 [Hirsutella minnesotensis 3608]|uniref:Helicase C-terminal domain-containing protein n=1 Tax=Hirsutella minnesotensis 3608 TaxID=1043627 RepID=A0A0F7ZYC9_9HYPO|nr:hypothetical protein HIM_08394 [Hirsutella minnesotensis 3608]
MAEQSLQDKLTLEGIKQFYIDVGMEDKKYDVLKVDFITEKLRGDDILVSAIHDEMEQAQRETAMKEFRSGSSRLMISTDLLARGIDIQQVSVVISYESTTSLPTMRTISTVSAVAVDSVVKVDLDQGDAKRYWR